MRSILTLFAAFTALSACATQGLSPAERQEQTATIAAAAEGYPAFQIQPGQRLYLAPGQRVRTW